MVSYYGRDLRIINHERRLTGVNRHRPRTFAYDTLASPAWVPRRVNGRPSSLRQRELNLPARTIHGPGADDLALGDLNSDGNPDLALVQRQPRGVRVRLGAGDGPFAPGQAVGRSSRDPWSVSTADVN